MKRIKHIIAITLCSISVFFTFQVNAQKLGVELLPGEDMVFEQAQLHFEEGNFEQSKEGFSQLLSLYPRERYFNYAYGACLVNLNTEFNKSIDYLEYALDGGVYQANYYLGMVYHLNYMFEKAIYYYEAFRQTATPKELKSMPVDRQIRMAKNGINLLRYAYELQVLKNKKVKNTNFYYSYEIVHSGGEIVVIPEEFKSKIDKKRKYNGLMYVSKVFDLAFFSSYGTSKDNSLDLYVVAKSEGKWGNPVLLPLSINTSEDEAFPFFHPSGEFLYFCSKGHNSMGGYDIFKISYDRPTNTWGEAKNLDFPTNTPLDDIMYITDSRDITAYFASTRETESGKIGVYQVLLERDPPQRMIESMADIRNTSKLDISPLAMQLYEKRVEEMMAVNIDSVPADSLIVPDENNGFRKDSAILNQEYDLIVRATENLEKLDNNILGFRNQYYSSLRLIEDYIREIEKLETERKSVERMNLQPYEKQARLQQLDDKIYSYTDSIASVKSLAEEYARLADDVANRVAYYKTETDKLFGDNSHSIEKNNALLTVNQNMELDLQKKPENRIVESNRRTLADNSRKIEENHNQINKLSEGIGKIDKEILQWYDSLSIAEDEGKQNTINANIRNLETQRRKLVSDYKELYLKQEFLMSESRNLTKETEIAEQCKLQTVADTAGYNDSRINQIMANANRFISRRNQKNLKEMADLQTQVLDSVFFDNSKLLPERFTTENQDIAQQTKEDKTRLNQIVIIGSSPFFEETGINRSVNKAEAIVSELISIENQLENETDLNKRKKLIDQYDKKQQELDTVYSVINNEINKVNQGLFVEEIVVAPGNTVRDMADKGIDSLKNSDNEKDALLAEDYLNTADSLYALAATQDGNNESMPALQDYYLKQAMAYENKALQIVAPESTYIVLNGQNQPDSLTNPQVDSLTTADNIARTNEDIVKIQAESGNKPANDSIRNLAAANYHEVDLLLADAGKARNESKKNDLLNEATNKWKQARNEHAQLARNEINTNLEQFYAIESGYLKIVNTGSDPEKQAQADVRKARADSLHTASGNLLLQSEETANDSLKNELLIAAAELEKQAVDQYREAYHLVSGYTLPEDKNTETALVTPNNKSPETIGSNLLSMTSEPIIVSEDSIQIANAAKFEKSIEAKLHLLDSTLLVTENISREIVRLEAEYASNSNAETRDNIVKEIVVLQNERLDAISEANKIIAEIQGDKILRNQELIIAEKKMYKSNKKLLSEIERDFEAYGLKKESMQTREQDNYFVMLDEVIIMGESLLTKQNRLMAEAGTATKTGDETLIVYKDKIVSAQSNSNKTSEWISEQESLLAGNNIVIADTLTTNPVDTMAVIADDTLALLSEQNQRIAENKLQISNALPENIMLPEGIQSEQQRLTEIEQQAAALRTDIELHRSEYSQARLLELDRQADSLETALVKRQEQFVRQINDYLAYADSQQQIRRQSENNKTRIKETIPADDTLAAAVYRAETAGELLTSRADSIAREIGNNYATYSPEKIARLQREELDLRNRAIDLQEKGLEIAENNNRSIAAEINSTYDFIDYTAPVKPDTLIVENITRDTTPVLITPGDTLIVQIITRDTIPVQIIPGDTLVAENITNDTTPVFVEPTDTLVAENITRDTSPALVEPTDTLLAIEPVNKTQRVRLPDDDLKLDTEGMTADDEKMYRKIADERDAYRSKTEKADTQIASLENKMQASTSERKKARLEKKIQKTEEKRNRYILDYYNTNTEIARLETDRLNKQYEGIAPIHPENGDYADSLRNLARQKEQLADQAAAQAENETSSSERARLYAYSDSLRAESIRLHSEAIGIAADFVSVRPRDIQPLRDTVLVVSVDTVIVTPPDTLANKVPRDTAPTDLIEASQKGLVFRIQFAAFNRIVGDDYTRGLSPLFTENVPGKNLIRYMTGVFGTYELAAGALPAVKKLGFTDAFVVAYLDGRRISMQEANAWLARNAAKDYNLLAIDNRTVTTGGNTNLTAVQTVGNTGTNNTPTADTHSDSRDVALSRGVFLTVQFAASKRVLTPAEIYGLIADYHEYLANGYIRHMSGQFYTMADANAARNRIRTAGAADAFVVAYRNGVRIPVNEALLLIKDQPIEATNLPQATDTTPRINPVNVITDTASASPNNVYEIEIYVQVGAYRQEVPAETMAMFNEIANGSPVKFTRNNNLLIYRIGPFDKKQKAAEIRQRAVNAGITDAFMLAYRNGKQIPLRDIIE